jgi:hypothetical protein
MEFDWNFQGLVNFEQGAPDCTWMTHQPMKRNFKIQIYEFLELLQQLDLNLFES